VADINVSGRMKVRTLKDAFRKEFGCGLRVYRGRRFADDEDTVASIRDDTGRDGVYAVKKNMKVGNAERRFKEEFGITVQIEDASGKLADNDLTLAAVGGGEETEGSASAEPRPNPTVTTQAAPSVAAPPFTPRQPEQNTCETQIQGLAGVVYRTLSAAQSRMETWKENLANPDPDKPTLKSKASGFVSRQATTARKTLSTAREKVAPGPDESWIAMIQKNLVRGFRATRSFISKYGLIGYPFHKIAEFFKLLTNDVETMYTHEFKKVTKAVQKEVQLKFDNDEFFRSHQSHEGHIMAKTMVDYTFDRLIASCEDVLLVCKEKLKNSSQRKKNELQQFYKIWVGALKQNRHGADAEGAVAFLGRH
jgi:hypothetical protein